MNNHFNKRGRNNHQRRRQGVNPNRALDSNGPDVRIRGTAQQIYDKYQALARDATSSGDRVKAENYLQHAEHYFRVLRSVQGSQPTVSDQNAGDLDFDGDQPPVGEARAERQYSPQADDDGEADAPAPAPAAAKKSQAELDANADGGEQRANESRQSNGEQDAGRRRRRRPRRPREDGAPEDAAADDAEPVPAG